MKWMFVLVLMPLFLLGCKKPDAPVAEEKAAAHWKIGLNERGESVVTLDEQTVTNAGIKVEALAPVQFEREIKVFGRAVDPSGLAAAVAEYAGARAAAAVSKKDLARIAGLSAQSNASPRALETAQGAAARDAALAEAASAKLIAAWGKKIPARADLGDFTDALVNGRATLVRLDLPVDESLTNIPARARLVLNEPTNSLSAEYLDSLPFIDASTQTAGLLFLVTNAFPMLKPGAAVAGYLKTSDGLENGVVIPFAAVVRYQAKSWAYRQTGDHEWTRTEVKTSRLADGGWFVPTMEESTNRVMIVGAQQILSEEIKGSGGIE